MLIWIHSLSRAYLQMSRCFSKTDNPTHMMETEEGTSTARAKHRSRDSCPFHASPVSMIQSYCWNTDAVCRLASNDRGSSGCHHLLYWGCSLLCARLRMVTAVPTSATGWARAWGADIKLWKTISEYLWLQTQVLHRSANSNNKFR